MRLTQLILLSCALAAPLTAHADDFTFSGTLNNSVTLTGTFSLDSSGNITAASITAGADTFDTLISNGNFGGLTVQQIADLVSNDVLVLFLPGNFHGGNVCSDAHPCSAAQQSYSTYMTPNNSFNQIDLADGTATDLTPSGTTPEPSSIALLGTGILGLAGTFRRRLHRD